MTGLGLEIASGIKSALIPAFFQASTNTFMSSEFVIVVGGLFMASFTAFILFGSDSVDHVDLPSLINDNTSFLKAKKSRSKKLVSSNSTIVSKKK